MSTSPRLSQGIEELAPGLPEFMTHAELAAFLKMRPETLYRMARPPVIRFGRRVRYARGDVLRWLEARREVNP